MLRARYAWVRLGVAVLTVSTVLYTVGAGNIGGG
jgi:hypothetical protein